MDDQLQFFVKTHTPLIQHELEAYFKSKKQEATALSPHLLDSLTHIEEFSLRGGKYIRSLLVVLAYQLASGEKKAIYKIAAAVELFHKYILNVDDIADRDELRYGGPTLWQFYQEHFSQLKWSDYEHHGRTFAEIDGVLMASFVTELVRTADFSAEKLLEILSVIDQLMYWQTIAGWQIHYFQNNERLRNASETEYLKGLELVTGYYTFVAPLKIGILLGAKNDQQRHELTHLLTEYGVHVGRAFQLQDDILGVFGNSKETGKPVGNDVREGKKTVLMQYAYRHSGEDDQEFLEDICGRELQSGELERVREIMRASGALQYVEKIAQDSIEKALAILDKLGVQDSKNEVNVLRDVAKFVMKRKK